MIATAKAREGEGTGHSPAPTRRIEPAPRVSVPAARQAAASPSRNVLVQAGTAKRSCSSLSSTVTLTMSP